MSINTKCSTSGKCSLLR